MGIWDAVISKVDGLNWWLPDPSLVKGACASAYNLGSCVVAKASATTPDLSSVTGTCRRSYDRGLAGASGVYRTIRVDAPRRISETLSNSEIQERLRRSAWNIVDRALDQGTKPYTGGIPVYKILKEELFSSNRPEAASAFGVVTAQKEMIELRNRLEKLEALMADRGDGSSSTAMEGFGALQAKRFTRSTLEDAGGVISLFMKSGFKDGNFIHQQVVPAMDDDMRLKRRRDGPSPTELAGFGALEDRPFTWGTLEDAGGVISLFMKTGFNGGDFIHQQVVPAMNDNLRLKQRRDFLLCMLQ